MKVYTVSEFREEINELMGEVTVAVQGEVTDFSISQNRFVWFSLADENTVVKCFMMAFQLKVPLEEGMEIRAVGSPNLFKKGQFVFRPRQIDLVGDGSLRQAYELLKKKLEKEGLFDSSRKRELPRFPEKIGLVTSKDAAAYTDVLRILQNRWAGLDIKHRHVSVQGVQAVNSIVSALDELNQEQADVDCIILTRGGGSLEDLQAFNSEEVARAVFSSKIPVVCGVGHERDVTLADLTADVRASTPSNAAEIVVPDKVDIIQELDYMAERCEHQVKSRLQAYEDSISRAVQTLDTHARQQIARFRDMHQKLLFAFQEAVAVAALRREQLTHAVQLLKSYNPLHILQRGYTVTTDSKGVIIKKAKQVKDRQRIQTRFADGEVESQVFKK